MFSIQRCYLPFISFAYSGRYDLTLFDHRHVRDMFTVHSFHSQVTHLCFVFQPCIHSVKSVYLYIVYCFPIKPRSPGSKKKPVVPTKLGYPKEKVGQTHWNRTGYRFNDLFMFTLSSWDRVSRNSHVSNIGFSLSLGQKEAEVVRFEREWDQHSQHGNRTVFGGSMGVRRDGYRIL